jgi:fatty-acyl-CoA synthase
MSANGFIWSGNFAVALGGTLAAGGALILQRTFDPAEALPGNVIKIVDPATGAVVPRGHPGEIAVKGPALMLGYIGIPLSETLDDEGFFHSGDGGYIDEQGRLHFDGRLTDIIKTGGANVSPVEVDSVLTTCPGVKAAATIGVPHETLGEIVVSCIVPHDGINLDQAGVRDFLKQRLASYKVPRRILLMREEDLTLTGSAKIRAGALRELVAKRIGAGDAAQNARDTVGT